MAYKRSSGRHIIKISREEFERGMDSDRVRISEEIERRWLLELLREKPHLDPRNWPKRPSE